MEIIRLGTILTHSHLMAHNGLTLMETDMETIKTVTMPTALPPIQHNGLTLMAMVMVTIQTATILTFASILHLGKWSIQMDVLSNRKMTIWMESPTISMPAR